MLQRRLAMAASPAEFPRGRVIACAFALACFGIAAWPMAAPAQECPTGQSGMRGFVVERADRLKTEVFHVGDTEIRTVLHFDGTETTQYQGLFDLERSYRGKQSTFKPTSDLSSIYPPNVGQKITARFEASGGERQFALNIVLHVKRLDEMFIGRCRYRVLVIDRSVGRNGSPPMFVESDYYSPELKLTVAKEFKESGGRTSLNKFERIYPLQP